MVPEGLWPGVVKETQVRMRRELKYVLVRIETMHGDVFVSLVPRVKWRYKAQLEALGADMQLYFEWDGVDLSETMCEALTLVLPESWCHVWVKHVTFRGLTRAEATLVREDP